MQRSDILILFKAFDTREENSDEWCLEDYHHENTPI